MKTKFYSWKNGSLCRGCKLCVKGEKLVLFITGVCPRNCWYCSISEKKKNKDVIFANERPINNVNEAIEEAKLCDATGAGITGGDPLSKLDRTLEYIKALKKEFKDFHIHLYTSLNLVDEDKLKQLFEAGLDEIRFHLDLDDKLWDKLELARKFRWKVGVEIPVIPGKKDETVKLIEFVKDKIDFLNLNELEYSEINSEEYQKRDLTAKNELSYGIQGSEELALELLEQFPDMNIHYCTSKLKDGVQLANRIKRRAKNVKENFDIVTKEGMLIRGAVYDAKDLEKAKQEIGLNEIKIDKLRNRLLMSKKNIKKYTNRIKKLGYKSAIVEEYPTWDALQIEVTFL